MTTQEHRETEGRRTSVAPGCWIVALLASGAALGATLMYLWHPNRGKARRARLQERAAHTSRRTAQELTRKGEDMLNRTKGAFARMVGAMTCHEEDDDEVVAARVRSHMGHVTEHAHAVKTEVKDGIVTLHGVLPEGDRQQVIEEVRGIPGVKDVQDQLAAKSLSDPAGGPGPPNLEREIAHSYSGTRMVGAAK